MRTTLHCTDALMRGARLGYLFAQFNSQSHATVINCRGNAALLNASCPDGQPSSHSVVRTRSRAAHFLSGSLTSAGVRLAATAEFLALPGTGSGGRRTWRPPSDGSPMAFRAPLGTVDRSGNPSDPMTADCHSGMDNSRHFVKVAGRRIAFRTMVRASWGIPECDPAQRAVPDRNHPMPPRLGLLRRMGNGSRSSDVRSIDFKVRIAGNSADRPKARGCAGA